MYKTLCSLIVASFIFLIANPIKAGTPLIAGHALTNGQIIVGVTGSAAVANRLIGTANQLTVTNSGTEGGNTTLSLPANLTVTNLTVSGTLSPYSTGTFTSDNLTANYGVAAATASLSDTSASSLIIGGGMKAGTGSVQLVDATGKITALTSTYLASVSGAALTSLTPANVSAGSLPSTVIVSSWSASAAINATSVRALAGPVTLFPRTKAEHDALSNTYHAGDLFTCSNCTSPFVYVVAPSVMVQVSSAAW